MNGWAHDYWRTIGYAEFWRSLDEASTPAGGSRSAADPVAVLEEQVAAATGLPA